MHPLQPSPNLRILVVDDNEAIHRDFRKILRSDDAQTAFEVEDSAFFGTQPDAVSCRNFELTFARQGEEALRIVTADLAAGRRYALVFMDVRMPPGWDGLESARRLWEVDADLQMVICTAYSDKSWPVLAAELGNPERVLILKKPFDTIEVLQLAHALTEKWALIQAARENTRFLEAAVAARTRELSAANARLEAETARVREQALLIEKARDAIVVWDLDGTIRFWNRGAEILYGWTAREAAGRCVFDLLGCSDPGLARLLATGDWQGELHQTTRDGEEVIADCHWTLVRDEASRPKSVLGIHGDITGKKQLEANFLRAQRLETVGTLAGGIAHDLNNILHPISLAMDILRSSVSDPGGREMLDLVAASAERASGLVRQVLGFARGVQGERVPFQPDALAREVGRIVKGTFPKDIAFRFSQPGDIGTITGDSTQLHQVLLNLCVNARDAMPDGGLLTLSVEEVEVTRFQASSQPGAKPGRHIRFTVTDSGSGIPAALQEKIFDPFFTTKEPGKGTGLGLSTSTGIVRSHGGFISLESCENSGTAFSVHIPADLAGEAEAIPPLPTIYRSGGGTILVVDDEATILRMITLTLESAGYSVLTAADGLEASRIFTGYSGQIDAVITDSTMPVMDGRALIRRLREIDPEVRILATTGVACEQGAAELRQLGAGDVIFKPFTAAAVLRALHELESTTALSHAC